MVRATNHRVLAGAVLALTALSGSLYAQAPLPPVPPAAGTGVPERLSPEEVERANRKREREQIVQKLRELHARGEYTEMLRVIQETERTMPNDMVLKQYGYMAQKALEDIEKGGDPLISPDSPALRRGGVGQGSGAPLPGEGSGAAAGTGLPGLMPTPAPSSSQSMSGLPPLPGGTDASSAQPAGGIPAPSAPAGGLPTPAPAAEAPATPVPTPAAPAVQEEQTGPAPSPARLALIGLAALFAVVGLVVFLKRRRGEAPAEKAPVSAGRTGAAAAIPPPLPGAAVPSYASQRDALTEVDMTEEEVARDIAQNIETRAPAPAVGSMPTFDMFIPEGKADMPTGFHDNLPTMVDEDQQDQPTMQLPPEPAPTATFSFFEEPKTAASSPEPPPVFAPAPPPAVDLTPAPPAPAKADPLSEPPAAPPAKPAGGLSMVSFEDLGISFGGDEPEPKKPVSPTPAPQPELPPLSLNLTPEPPEKQTVPAPTPSAGPVSSLPGLPGGDEPIRLDDLNFFAPPAQPAGTAASPAPAPGAGTGRTDDPSATVDLSELLFGKMDAPVVPEKTEPASDVTVTVPGAQGAERRTPSPFDETVSSPVVRGGAGDQTFQGSSEGLISLDALGLGSSAPATPAPPPSQPGAADIQNLETVQIPVLNEKLGAPPAPGVHPDDALSATVALDDLTVPMTGRIPGESAPREETPVPSPSAPADQQSYYASAPRAEGTLDERSERMFREQCDRADKAIAESNWKQAVHYLSIAAAIHPDDTEVIQRLKHAREQKRRQEAGV